MDRQIEINIPDNTWLEDALIDWGAVIRLTVMINAAAVHGHVAPQVRGHLKARAALTALLKVSSGTMNLRNDLNYVVVSAQKRNKRLEDVPVPVTEVEFATLLQWNQHRLQGYYSAVPGYAVPHIDPGDVARVEVLRGPQETLHGSSGMGGLLKLVAMLLYALNYIQPRTAGRSISSTLPKKRPACVHDAAWRYSRPGR
jgi:hypothetical protein